MLMSLPACICLICFVILHTLDLSPLTLGGICQVTGSAIGSWEGSGFLSKGGFPDGQQARNHHLDFHICIFRF